MPFCAKSVVSLAKSSARHLARLFHVKHSPLSREKAADGACKAYSRAEMAENRRPIRKRRDFSTAAPPRIRQGRRQCRFVQKALLLLQKAHAPSCLLVSRETFASLERKNHRCRKCRGLSSAAPPRIRQGRRQCRFMQKKRRFTSEKAAAPSCLLVSRETFASIETKTDKTENAEAFQTPSAIDGHGKPARIHNAVNKRVVADGGSTGGKKNRRTSRAAGFGKRSFPYLSFVWASAKDLFQGVTPAYSERKAQPHRPRIPGERGAFGRVAARFGWKG